ncbi:MAG: thioredoxin family protein [Planctomycetota bacterium]
MPPVESTMLDLGTEAPDFNLADWSGNREPGTPVSLDEFRTTKVLVVAFICNHCPFVKHIMEEIGRLGRDCTAKGLGFVAIMPNDVQTHPDDAPERMHEVAQEHGFSFPYLYDADQSVAKAYRAACTPDFYVFDANQRLVYRGQLDASRPGNDEPVTGHDLRMAIEAAMTGQEQNPAQQPSTGCSIKWKPGNEPEYWG